MGRTVCSENCELHTPVAVRRRRNLRLSAATASVSPENSVRGGVHHEAMANLFDPPLALVPGHGCLLRAQPKLTALHPFPMPILLPRRSAHSPPSAAVKCHQRSYCRVAGLNRELTEKSEGPQTTPESVLFCDHSIEIRLVLMTSVN